ncbi:hypothetical protein D3C73_710550 [compost metagenome]
MLKVSRIRTSNHTRGLKKTSLRREALPWLSVCRLALSKAFSAADSHLAESMLLARQAITTNAMITEGMPSMISIHCQPDMPCTPCMLFINQPDRMPPRVRLIGIAIRNPDITRLCRWVGNQ